MWIVTSILRLNVKGLLVTQHGRHPGSRQPFSKQTVGHGALLLTSSFDTESCRLHMPGCSAILVESAILSMDTETDRENILNHWWVTETLWIDLSNVRISSTFFSYKKGEFCLCRPFLWWQMLWSRFFKTIGILHLSPQGKGDILTSKKVFLKNVVYEKSILKMVWMFHLLVQIVWMCHMSALFKKLKI